MTETQNMQTLREALIEYMNAEIGYGFGVWCGVLVLISFVSAIVFWWK